MDVDAEVGAALAQGAPDRAAAAIVRGLGPGLLGYLASVLRSESDAREVFGDVAEEILTSVAGFRGESTVKTWSYRIAWRTAVRFRQSPERRRERRLDTHEASGLAAQLRDSTAEWQRTGAKAWLADARAALDPEDQSLLVLRIDRGLSWTEVAQVMGDGDDAAAQARLRKRYERIKDVLKQAADGAGAGKRNGGA